MNSDLAAIKARYSIAQAWRDLGLKGEPAKSCCSPFPGHRNDDIHPSFSVYDDGRKAKDHATGEHFDVFDFVAKAKRMDAAGAIEWVRTQLGATRPTERHGRKLPDLRLGSKIEHGKLAKLRGISVEAVALAETRGFLRFGALWNHPFWAITDARQRMVEFRRLDGRQWPAYGQLSERKSHCVGSGKDWPIGALESQACGVVAWFEGAGDLLAFFHFALIENKASAVAPVAMLGAANRKVAAEALALFQGKRIVLYPHCDEAGQAAAKSWARQLKASGGQVLAFDLSGIVKQDGSEGKDLGDLCFVSGDCYEANPHFREVLP